MFSFVSLESFKHIYSYKSCAFLLSFFLWILSFFSYFKCAFISSLHILIGCFYVYMFILQKHAISKCLQAYIQ